MSTLTAKDLIGSMTALLTPMSSNGSIDYKQWCQLLSWQIKAKTTAVIVAGTTGESALLDESEIEELIKLAVKMCSGTKTKVIVGTGHIKTHEIIVKNNKAKELGADAVLIVTPYYIRTTQTGLIKHFTDIADVSQLPIILYNVPSRTQNDLLVKSTIKLARHNNIIGIK
ncbi:MAG: dihydrodipicolinate synthase family protein, partial [Marinicellaceae bacterium]